MVLGDPVDGLDSGDAADRCQRHDDLVRGSYDPLTLAIKVRSVVRQVTRAELHCPIERTDENIVFLHEHSHLLQEVTTLYGLACFAIYFRILPRLSGHCQHAPLIQLPVMRSGERIPEAEEWHRWRGYIEGGVARDPSSPPFNERKGYEIVAVRHSPSWNRVKFGRLAPENGFPIHSTVVTVKQGALYDLHVGAHAIGESLANMLDSVLYDAASITRTSKAPPYPYELLWSLAKFISKKKGVQRASRATLATFADRALMTLSPGYFVAKYLESHAGNPSRAPHDVCDQVERHAGWRLDEPLATVHAVFSEHLEKFKVSAHKTTFMEWFNRYVSRALENRLRDRNFYLTPFLSEDPWSRCDELRAAVPPPLIIDGANKLSSYEDQDGAKGAFDASRWFQSLKFVVKLLTEERVDTTRPMDVRCPLRDSCTYRNPADDGRCLVSPWVHADTILVAEDGREGTCATGSAFASIGVRDGKPVQLPS